MVADPAHLDPRLLRNLLHRLALVGHRFVDHVGGRPEPGPEGILLGGRRRRLGLGRLRLRSVHHRHAALVLLGAVVLLAHASNSCMGYNSSSNRPERPVRLLAPRCVALIPKLYHASPEKANVSGKISLKSFAAPFAIALPLGTAAAVAMPNHAMRNGEW